MRRMLLVCVILVFVSIANAQFVSALSSPAGRAHSAFSPVTPSINFIGPMSTTWYGKLSDTICISSGVITGVSFNFTPWFSLSATIPYYVDIKKTPSATYRSPGLGDICLNFEFRKKISRRTGFAFVPFMTLPSGDLRDIPPERASVDEDYIGGLFRDYSTTSYDYGAEFLFSTRKNRVSLNFELGFWNAYQMYFMGKSGNLGYVIANLAIENRVLSPFIEFYYSKYQDNIFGNAPVFLTPGLAIHFSRSFSIRSFVDIPLFDRGNVQTITPGIAPYYAGFLSQFPDYTPKIAFNMGLDFAPHLLKTKDKSRVIVFVKDKKTGKPIDEATCYLDEKYASPKKVG